ncbi:MAG: type IV secretion system protein [Bacteroidetes bacterium]|nr:type IV secretion system protein [Bacteroidota bacterium]
MQTFYTDLMKNVTDPLAGFISSTSGSVIGSITAVSTTLLMIYIMFWGWSMMRGVITEPITDGITRLVKLAIIVGIALSTGRYASYIVDFLWNAPDAMASVVAGAKSEDKVSFLDTLFEKMWAYSTEWEKAADQNKSVVGIPNLGQWLMAWLIRIVAALMTGYAAFLFVLAKIAIAILLAIGPIFILITMFESTRKYFEAWLSQCLNFGIVIVLAAAILKIVGTYIESSVMKAGTEAAGSANPSFFDGFVLIILCAICFVMLLQVMAMASGLAGGIAISTMGSFGWAYSKMRGATMGSINQAYRIGSGRSLSDWRGRRRSAAMNAKWARNNPSLAGRAGNAAVNASRSVTRKVTGRDNNNTVSKQ